MEAGVPCASVAVDDVTAGGSAVGRPRADQRPLERPARDEIVAVASRLFAEKGFAHTTMSEIAAAAGLRQSSLYYYFRRKEQILQATFTINRAPLDFIRRIGVEPGSAALKLYRLVRFDTVQLCRAPFDVNEIERLAVRQPDDFADFWADRQSLHDWVEQLVRQGCDDGHFVETDATLTALGLLSFNEGVQNWFRAQDVHRPGSGAVFTFPGYSAEQVADHVAGNALRALLRRPADLDRLRRQAAGFDDTPAQAAGTAGGHPGPAATPATAGSRVRRRSANR